MFPPLSRQAPSGASTSMWDSSRVCLSRTTPCTQRYSAPRCSARRHGRGAPFDDPMLGTSSSLPVIMPIWSSAGPRDADLRAWRRWLWSWVMLLRVGLEDGARPVPHVRQGARGVPIYGSQWKEAMQCHLPPSFFELTLSSPQFPHEVAERGKRKEEIYYTTS